MGKEPNRSSELSWAREGPADGQSALHLSVRNPGTRPARHSIFQARFVLERQTERQKRLLMVQNVGL